MRFKNLILYSIILIHVVNFFQYDFWLIYDNLQFVLFLSQDHIQSHLLIAKEITRQVTSIFAPHEEQTKYSNFKI